MNLPLEKLIICYPNSGPPFKYLCPQSNDFVKISVGVRRAKHLVQVHVWGGISNKGATNVIFTEIMNAECLGMIFEVGLLPFVRDHFADGNRLQQDNDPKHASGYIDNFCKENGMNWWCTPTESPDLTIWGSLKQYLRNIYKPKIWLNSRKEYSSSGLL